MIFIQQAGRNAHADICASLELFASDVLPEFAADANFVERFRREAQSAANLSHPNIVTLYDVGHDGGRSFIAMELGCSIEDIQALLLGLGLVLGLTTWVSAQGGPSPNAVEAPSGTTIIPVCRAASRICLRGMLQLMGRLP